MAGEGLPVQASTRVLNVTDSGYYAWRTRGPSARAVAPIARTCRVWATITGVSPPDGAHSSPLVRALGLT